MKAHKTPSGKWQCRPVDHYEYVNGKRKVVLACITRDTKQEALRAAYAYRDSRKAKTAVTVYQAIDAYYDRHLPTVEPTTRRQYKTIRRNRFKDIGEMLADELDKDILQRWINSISIGHTSAYASQAAAILLAAIEDYRPDFHPKLVYKKTERVDRYTPTDDDIKKLMDYVKGTDLERAIVIAAFGSPRRGEVCALTYEDIDGHNCTVSIDKETTQGDTGKITKQPKTQSSVRKIKYPRFAVDIILDGKGPGDTIVQLSPSYLSKCFQRAREAVGLPYFRFHDLRAYAASIRHALLIPDQYIMQDGGWSTDRTLKAIYRRTMDDKRDQFAAVAADHFEQAFGTQKDKSE